MMQAEVAGAIKSDDTDTAAAVAEVDRPMYLERIGDD